jgi:hypothetical protein
MIVGIYSLKISEINGMKFYLEKGSQEVGETLPSSVRFTDDKGVERVCSYDHTFSKEVGHHAYAYTQNANIPARISPTPIDFNASPSGESNIEDGSGSNTTV